MPLDVEGMAFKCQAGQTLAWDVDGMVGPGCYNTSATLTVALDVDGYAWTMHMDVCGMVPVGC